MSHQITGKSLVSLAGFHSQNFSVHHSLPTPFHFPSYSFPSFPTSSFSKPWMLFILFKLKIFFLISFKALKYKWIFFSTHTPKTLVNI